MHEVKLRLTGVRADGRHGVLDFEHEKAQPFVIDVEYVLAIPDEMDLIAAHPQCAPQSADSLSVTVSYAQIAEIIVARIKGEHAELIETLAHDIAREILALGVRKVSVVVHKPNAPINCEFTDVSATVMLESEIITAKPRKYLISLGSNLDNPVKHLQDACMEINNFCYEILNTSAIYRSAPILAAGQEVQPDYFNAMMEVSFRLSPLELLECLQEIERNHGRRRTAKWEARTLDLDLIASDFTATDFALTLPHPRAHLRRFVLQPWVEIHPDAYFRDKPLTQLLAEVADQRVERTDAELIPGGIKNINQWIEAYYAVENGATDSGAEADSNADEDADAVAGVGAEVDKEHCRDE